MLLHHSPHFSSIWIGAEKTLSSISYTDSDLITMELWDIYTSILCWEYLSIMPEIIRIGKSILSKIPEFSKYFYHFYHFCDLKSIKHFYILF